MKPGYVLKDPEIAKKLEQQLSNGENSKPQPQSAPEPQKVSVSTPLRQTPILQSNTCLKWINTCFVYCLLNLYLKIIYSSYINIHISYFV